MIVRWYFGGASAASALFTVFFEIPMRRAMALIGIVSARCNRRISAQSSTLITLQNDYKGVSFRPSPQGQFSPVVDTTCGFSLI
ncbi:hypothetical protein [Streptosporangium sp. NBC_01756]|uniref:hypothetical protein n=1 Tax=Streptosporangium sp. NBC_01756 TaxID=2975950 RepID=UPI002DDB9349|nr:hypothetical protein [Streptosporangium sp. NBC_01756]WSC90806.1 hypothetical protein OIE48_30120 [Streptosporangium sp. NBC_01756]